MAPSRRAVIIFGLAVGAIPLLFVSMPILGVILGAVVDFTGVFLSTDSGSLQVNALAPWFAVAFVLAAFFMIVGAVFVARHNARGR